jgi:hypothetical protein
VPVSLEISFSIAGGDSGSIQELSDQLEADLTGIGEVVGSDLAGSTGVLIVGGDEQYERRLIGESTAALSRVLGITAHHIDVVLFDGETIQSSRRIVLP